MGKWGFTQTNSEPGVFQILARKPGRGVVDISSIRGVPTEISNFSSGDPFGDAAAVLSFPGLSGFEDLDSPEIGSWLGDFTEIDINWLAGYPVAPQDANTIDPLTQELTLSVDPTSKGMVKILFPPDTDDGWDTPGALHVTETNPITNVKHGYPTSWPDSGAYWLWPNPPGPTVSDLPRVTALYRSSFTLGSTTNCTLYVTGDNEVQFWLDDTIVAPIIEGGTGLGWQGYRIYTMTLAPGDHQIKAAVVNSGVYEWRNGEYFDYRGNPGGLLYSLSVTGSPGTVIARSEPSTVQTYRVKPQRIKLYEGYIASIETSYSDVASGINVQCQGALYQADRYLQKPSYPPRPIPYESLIRQVFDHNLRPNLRTAPLAINWPPGWQLVVPPYTGVNAYTLDATPGTKYSGYSTRSTGAWDHSLTGFTADLLATMYVDEKAKVLLGNQWTVIQGANRRPILQVRDRTRKPDFSIWYGTAGVTCSLTRDNTQISTIIYGEGTAIDGSTWRNAIISADGSKTDYKPLAALQTQYPDKGNPAFDKSQFVSESLLKYGSGFSQDQAEASAKKTLQRDYQPGWSGEITLKIDPGMSKWTIRAGMSMILQGFMGTSETGMRFHIAQVVCNPQQGTVTLTVDTRYRDLLNLEEARARTRDPLTPSKMLQINRRTIMIEDALAPWDYTAGSGFIPFKSSKFHQVRDNSEVFPWKNFLKAHPPRQYPQWYVKVNADKARKADRWTCGTAVPILMSQKGTIRRTEIVAVDVDGNIIPVEFHFALYYVQVTVTSMPRDKNGPDPFLPNAFEDITETGAINNPYLRTNPGMIIGWGNHDQRAGYSPGSYSAGSPKTGILVDESTWTFDNTNNPVFNKNLRPGQKEPQSAFTDYGAFYCSYNQPVYFMGRFFRSEPGT